MLRLFQPCSSKTIYNEDSTRNPSPTTMSSPVVVSAVKSGSQQNGLKAYLKSLRKFSASTTHFHFHNGKLYKRDEPHVDHSQLEPHPHMQSHPVEKLAAIPPPGTIELPAHDMNHDSEYVVAIQVGTPPKTFLLNLDTGSSDLWINGRSNKNVAYYDPSESSTSKLVDGATWHMQYGDHSSASGRVYTDTVYIGSCAIEGQVVEVADTVSEEFLSENISGLLGLAWPGGNNVQPTQALTPVANMIGHGKTGIFSVSIEHESDQSFYTFGGIDAERAGVKESDIAYVSCISPPRFWQTTCEDVSINGKLISRHGNTAIFDTGTTLCLMSKEVVDRVYKHIHGATCRNSDGLWLIPVKAKIPQIEIRIGGKFYTINPDKFSLNVHSEDWVMGGIQNRGNLTFDVLGDVLFKSLYVVFDQEKCRVGLAQRPIPASYTSKRNILDTIFHLF